MKAFRFRLDSVLTLRTWEEERARTAYGQALAFELRARAELGGVETRIAASLESFSREASQPGLAGSRVRQWRHLVALERERTDASQKLSSARRIREQKMKLLLDAHRRVRVLEALRDRQRHAHRAESLRHEEREIEDLMSARHSINH